MKGLWILSNARKPKKPKEVLTPAKNARKAWWDNLIAKLDTGSCTVWGQGSMEGAFERGFNTGVKSIKDRESENGKEAQETTEA